MTTTEFIGRHLPESQIANIIEPCDTVCAFTGKPITRGVPLKTLIKKTFTDYEYLRFASKYASVEAALCMSEVLSSSKEGVFNALRVYSFIVTESELRLLKRDEIATLITNPLPTPFVLCVTFSNKKHISFKAEVNYDSHNFSVETDKGRVQIEIGEFLSVYEIAQRWYTIIPALADKAQPPTWFTKSEIAGETEPDTYRMLAYAKEFGLDAFKVEYDALRRYKNTIFVELLTFLLCKDGITEDPTL